jgi:hypothetical protein
MSEVDRLLALDLSSFRVIVDRDLRRDASAAEAAALRTPELADKWVTALTAISKSVDGQLGARRADYLAARARFSKSMSEADYLESRKLQRSWAEVTESYAKARGATLRFKSGLEEALVEASYIARQTGSTPSIQVWRYADAPKELHRLTDKATDDWLVCLIPSRLVLAADSFEDENGNRQTDVELIADYQHVLSWFSDNAGLHVLPNGDVAMIGEPDARS